MKLVFATNNIHKIREIQNLISKEIEIVSLAEIGCIEEIPETGNTIESNASEKAFYIYNKFGFNCFADDTGLEIDALDGRPGVYSARYAGEKCSFEENVTKVLGEMTEIVNRKARFRTVISLIIDGKEVQFEGIVEGVILREKHGDKGFGYDPVFQPNEYSETFAEMPLEIKNTISHRFKAIQKLMEYINKKIN